MKLSWTIIAVMVVLNNAILNSAAPSPSPKDEPYPADHKTNVDTTKDGINVIRTGNHETNVTDLSNHASTVTETGNQETEVTDSNKPSQRGVFISGNSNGFSTSNSNINKDGKCVTVYTISGPGIVDSVDFPCSSASLSSHISQQDILLANEDTVEINSIYGKQQKPFNLQVIQDGKCSVRTYTTASMKTSTAVTGSQCDAMKKEHRERMQKWKQWEADTFPPCFPFCGTNKPGKPYQKLKPQSKPPGSAYGNYDPWIGSANSQATSNENYNTLAGNYNNPASSNGNYNPWTGNANPVYPPIITSPDPNTASSENDKPIQQSSPFGQFLSWLSQYFKSY